MSKYKSLAVQLGKILFAGGLIYYLIHSGDLNFTAVFSVFTKPFLGLSFFGFFLLGQILLGATRWMYLLKGVGYSITLIKACRLQVMGFFFNTAMPGAVGGDLIKVLYVIRDNPSRGKTPAMLSIFLDRVIGLSGLFCIGLVSSCFELDFVFSDPILSAIFLTKIVLILGIFLFFFAALYRYKKEDPFSKILSKEIFGFPQILKIYESLRAYRDQPKTIVRCFGISVVIQLMSLLLFYLITKETLAIPDVSFGKIALIFPIGIFSMALPLAPGGLGVGHVAFDKLFDMIGLTSGATIANIYIVSLLFLNLFGVISYLMERKEIPKEGELSAT